MKCQTQRILFSEQCLHAIENIVIAKILHRITWINATHDGKEKKAREKKDKSIIFETSVTRRIKFTVTTQSVKWSERRKNFLQLRIFFLSISNYYTEPRLIPALSHTTCDYDINSTSNIFMIICELILSLFLSLWIVYLFLV